MEKLKVESASVRISNANESDRAYSISANAQVENGAIKRIDGGQVRDTESDSYLAHFDCNSDSRLNIVFQTTDGRAKILTAVEDFVANCNADEDITSINI